MMIKNMLMKEAPKPNESRRPSLSIPTKMKMDVAMILKREREDSQRDASRKRGEERREIGLTFTIPSEEDVYRERVSFEEEMGRLGRKEERTDSRREQTS